MSEDMALHLQNPHSWEPPVFRRADERLEKCQFGSLTFYRNPDDGIVSVADGGVWISALFKDAAAAASWAADGFIEAERQYLTSQEPLGRNLGPPSPEFTHE